MSISNSREIRDLLTSIEAGDEQAFRRLVDTYDAFVATELSWACRDVGTVDDLVQEVWIVVWRKNSQFRGSLDGSPEADRRAFAGWLRRICASVARKAARRIGREQRAVALLDEVSSQTEPGHEEPRARYEARKEILLDWVMELPPRQRAVVLHRKLEERGGLTN
jgi:RNA polymerase sigma factor (sigma-70 family)